MKHIEIFKPGKRQPMKGPPIEFTDAHMQASVAAYDPAVHEAPLVVGHPEHNLPAYGWVKSLAFADGVMKADPDQVNPEFADLVNAGSFKKVSAAFYAPGSPNHPLAGKAGHDTYYLRHVGFLGAQAPAVKGLRSPSFADAEEGVVEIEFADWAQRNNAGLWRRMRDWIIETAGLEKADTVLPEWEINSLQEAALAPSPAASVPSFSESPPTKKEKSVDKTPEQLAAEADLQRRATELQQREAAFAEREKANRRTEIAAFAEGLVKDGKLLPKDKDGVVAFMATLPADGVVEFGEGDGKQSTPSGDWLRGFLTGLPKQVEFAEVAGSQGVKIDDNTDAKAIAQRAVEFQEAEEKAGRVISVTAAVQHVTKGASK